MAVFGGGSAGAVLKLQCPHCHAVQARERRDAGATYGCKACGKRFTREAGIAAAKGGKNR